MCLRHRALTGRHSEGLVDRGVCVLRVPWGIRPAQAASTNRRLSSLPEKEETHVFRNTDQGWPLVLLPCPSGWGQSNSQSSCELSGLT